MFFFFFKRKHLKFKNKKKSITIELTTITSQTRDAILEVPTINIQICL